MIEITDEAITKILEKQAKEGFDAIRLGITGGGCAGLSMYLINVMTYPARKTYDWIMESLGW